MATSTPKVLGQNNPAAITATTLYVVPAATNVIGSTLTICNQAAVDATYRVAIRVAGTILDPKQYVAYDATVFANDFISLTFGWTLAATDIVTVYASTTTLSFNLFGTELVA